MNLINAATSSLEPPLLARLFVQDKPSFKVLIKKWVPKALEIKCFNVELLFRSWVNLIFLFINEPVSLCSCGIPGNHEVNRLKETHFKLTASLV